MIFDALPLLAFAFVFGIQHALDPDHIVAVSSLVSRQHGFRKSAWCGIKWGIGHTATLFIAGSLILFFKVSIPETVAITLETVVGLMIIALGISVLYNLFVKKAHVHIHNHDGNNHFHYHSHQHVHDKMRRDQHPHSHQKSSFLVGIVHGLAGSASLLLLVLSTINSVSLGLFYIIVFGLGTIVGMTLVSGLLSIPFSYTSERYQLTNYFLKYATGTFSILFGLFYIFQIIYP